MTSNSGELPDSLHDLPVKHCQSRFCPNRGPFTDRRIVAVGRYDPEIIGWCNSFRADPDFGRDMSVNVKIVVCVRYRF